MDKLLSHFLNRYPGPYRFCCLDGDESLYDFYCQSTRSYLFTIQNYSEDGGGSEFKAIADAILFRLETACNPRVREAV